MTNSEDLVNQKRKPAVSFFNIFLRLVLLSTNRNKYYLNAKLICLYRISAVVFLNVKTGKIIET